MFVKSSCLWRRNLGHYHLRHLFDYAGFILKPKHSFSSMVVIVLASVLTVDDYQEAAKRVGEEFVKACNDLHINEISSYDRNGFACGERMQAFEIAISGHGFLPR